MGGSTRPLGSLLQVQLELLRPQALNGVVLGLAVLGIASARLGFRWSLAEVLLALAEVFGAWLVYGGVWVTVASTSFWTQECGIGFFPVFYSTINFSRYPLTLYPVALRFVLTFVLPYAFMAFYPAAGLLRGEYTPFAWLTLPVGLVVFGAGLLVWERGLARYEGIGS